MNKSCTSRAQSYMTLLFDDSVMEAESTSNTVLTSPPLTSKNIPLTQLSEKKSNLSVYLPDFPLQFNGDQPIPVNLTSSTRLQIVDLLFMSICKITLYPYPEDLRAVVNKMLLRYPTLIDINGDGSMWLKCLTNKFKNFRRNLLPEKKAFQCKGKINSSVTTVTKNADNDGEDDFSSQFHEQAMQAEMRKCEQDVDFLKKRMQYTFRQRKEWISISYPKVADIINCFPAIIHSEELWHQEVELDGGLKVPTCRAFLASNGDLLRKALKTPQEYDDDDLLMAINHYLNPRSVIVKQKPESADMQPTVYLEGKEYILSIEGVVVAQKKYLVDFIHAKLCFFYAFNLEYPSGSKSFWDMLAVAI
ncbi:uncharacterized protein LOC136091480 isoform X2 [Hydra vulgaris]|uniref:Uncharacterized protein LOC136091480 isoform X2 n=1 Tax=Hydra vulgaris TaxID=6087 RepID=A0ABM4DKV7_HYDVU